MYLALTRVSNECLRWLNVNYMLIFIHCLLYVVMLIPKYKKHSYLVTLQTLPELLHGKVILNSLE